MQRSPVCTSILLLLVALSFPLLSGCTQQTATFNLNEGWVKQKRAEIRTEAGELSVMEYAKHPEGATLALFWRRLLEKHFENKVSALLPILAVSFGAKVNTVSEPTWINLGTRRVIYATAEQPKKYYFYAFYEKDTMFILMGIVEPPLNGYRASRFKRELESMLANFTP